MELKVSRLKWECLLNWSMIDVGTAELSHSSGIGARRLVVLLVPAAEASK
jgi:hypothetical protein